jgi:hypothetical protein
LSPIVIGQAGRQGEIISGYLACLGKAAREPDLAGLVAVHDNVRFFLNLVAYSNRSGRAARRDHIRLSGYLACLGKAAREPDLAGLVAVHGNVRFFLNLVAYSNGSGGAWSYMCYFFFRNGSPLPARCNLMLYSFFALAYLALAYLLIFFSIVTLFFERKFIAIAQKRLGISFLGRNGWVHLPADMVKFWFKYTGKNVGNWLTNSAGFFIILVGYFIWNLLSCAFLLSDGGLVMFDS